jgi:hypothetical protein
MKDNDFILPIYLYSYPHIIINLMIFIIQLYLRLARRYECNDDAREVTIQREQYDVTVQLFIGMGRSPDKITFVPLTFTLSYNTSYQTLSSRFPLRSVSSSSKPKLLEPQLRCPSTSPSGCIFLSHTFIMRELSSQSRSFL